MNTLRDLVLLVSAALCGHALAACGPSGPGGTRVCTIKPSIDRGALCNDGTLPVFSYRHGSGAGSTRWVIWFEGGGQCTDQASCAARASADGNPNLVTAAGFKATTGQGLLSPLASVNPALHDANAVLLHYCSSDTWAGDRAASGQPFDAADPTTWSFRGRRIALAQIASLKAYVPAFASATQILVGGSSAGGIGATVVLNDMLPLLPPGADIRFANDAGFLLDIGQYDASAPPPYVYRQHPDAFEATLPDWLSFWHGRGDVTCDATATTRKQHAACYDTATVLQSGAITLPSFVAESQLDTAQITYELCPAIYGACSVSHDPDAPPGIYATAFAARMASAIAGAGTAAAYSAYAPDAYLHVLLQSDTAFTTALQFGHAMRAPRDAFDHWLANPAQRTIAIGTGPGVE